MLYYLRFFIFYKKLSILNCILKIYLILLSILILIYIKHDFNFKLFVNILNIRNLIVFNFFDCE